MKKLTLFIMAFAFALTGFSQSVERSLVSSGGGSYQAGDYQADVSVGEPVIASFVNGSYILTQGYQQNILIVTDVEVLAELEFEMFPNPSSDYIQLTCPDVTNQSLKLEVYNLQGQLVCLKEISDGNSQIDVSQWKNGTYMLRISEDNKVIQTSKIIKQ